jgi:protease-4
VSKVAASRKRPYDQIAPLAEGRVWMGDQAKDRGLVDELGGIDRAIEMVKEKAKIGKDEKVTIATYPPRRTIVDLALGRIPEGADSRLGPLAKLARETHAGLLARSGLLRLMPYTIRIR